MQQAPQDHSTGSSVEYSNSRVVSEPREVADMNEKGKAAYRKAKRRSRRFNWACILGGVIATIVAVTVRPWWLIFGAAVIAPAATELKSSGVDYGALAQGRLAEHDPPEFIPLEERARRLEDQKQVDESDEH